MHACFEVKPVEETNQLSPLEPEKKIPSRKKNAYNKNIIGIRNEGYREKNLRRIIRREAGIKKGALTGLAPWEVFMLILTISANFATVANLLYQVLHNRKNGTDSIVFRFGKKKLKISGDFSQRDIEIILNEFTEVAKGDQLIKFLDDARRKELEKELGHLQEILPTYKRLVEPKGWKKSKEAITKLEYYQSRQKEIEQRISVLEKLLSTNGYTNI